MTTTEATSTDTDLAEFRAKVRAKAEEYLNSGYGSVDTWNRMLVTCGLEPIRRKRVKVHVEVPTVVVEGGINIPQGYEDEPERWLERQGGAKALVDWYGDAARAWQNAEPTYEVVEEAPGIDGVVHDENAFTTDLRAYKRLVRREGLKLKREHDWCNSGTEAVFEEVGLGSVNGAYVKADLTVTRRVDISIPEAIDEQEVVDMLAAGEIDLAQAAREADVFGYRERVVEVVLVASDDA